MKTKTIRTKNELAKRLGISGPTLTKYLTFRGAPTKGVDGWDLAAVAAHIAAHAETEATGAKTSNEIGALKARELALKCDRLKFKLECERGQWIKRTDVAGAIMRIMAPARNHLEAKLVFEYPSVVAGLNDAPQVRVYSRRLFDETLDAFQEFANEFEA